MQRQQIVFSYLEVKPPYPTNISKDFLFLLFTHFHYTVSGNILSTCKQKCIDATWHNGQGFCYKAHLAAANHKRKRF